MMCYQNGEYIDIKDASISICDKGFNFGYGIYEVILVHGGCLINVVPHIQRMYDTARYLNMSSLPEISEMFAIMQRVVKYNNLDSGSIYIQITPGHASNRGYADVAYYPSVIMLPKNEQVTDTVNTVRVLTHEDTRHGYRNIKTTSLLPNILLKNYALEHGLDDVIMYDKDSQLVSECTSSNVFIVNQHNQIITPRDSGMIVPGITRKILIELFQNTGITIMQQDITLNEIYAATEIFATASITKVRAIVQVNNYIVNNGIVGPITLMANNLYNSFIKNKTLHDTKDISATKSSII